MNRITRENLIELKDELKNKIGEYAEYACKFDEDVNKLTMEEAGCGTVTMSRSYVENQVMAGLCWKIIDSRMSSADKGYILTTFNWLLNFVKKGTVLKEVYDRGEWDEWVRNTADEYMEEHKDYIEMLNKRTEVA